MQKLTKKDRKRFDEVCRKVREFLHLEHMDYRYDFAEKDTRAEAGTRTTSNGWYLRIEVYPHFWETSAETQIRTIIHEHIHVCLIPFQQQVDYLVDRLHVADKELANDAMTKGLEISVSHLESVLYDLLHHQFS